LKGYRVKHKLFVSRNNPPLPSGWEKINSAVVSDALDEIGIGHQVMSCGTRPLDESLRLCARARTGAYMEVPYLEDDVNPYELEIALVDDLKAGDVTVLSCGGSSRIAPWGALLSTASVARGASGCVTDGYVRDIMDVKQLRFPVFSCGIAPLDSKGRGQIMATDVPVICDGVLVSPGDLVIGDADGVVVIPQAREAEVLEVAYAKIQSEDSSIVELRAGGFLRDIYAKYGVL
jgi:4-hydroxy-4-methyl-2-oxoglutarate aldolase